MKCRIPASSGSKKAIDEEIRRQMAEYDKKNELEIDALVLWILHEEFGFGPKRLKKFYERFAEKIDELGEYYSMPEEMPWLCTIKLRDYGIDLEEWQKERLCPDT